MEGKLLGSVHNATPSTSEFTVCFVGPTASDQREVDRIDQELVGGSNPGDGVGDLSKRDVHSPAANLTHEMVMIGRPFEVDDGRPVAQMNMLNVTCGFERVDSAVDRGLVDLLPRERLGSRVQVDCR